MFAPRVLAPILALCLSSLGCSKHGSDAKAEDQDEAGAGAEAGAEAGRSPDDPSPKAKSDRIPELTAAAVGLQPGYVDGALLYASVEAGTAQAFLQSIPFTTRDAKELAELGAFLGVDVRTGDVIAHLGVAADARVSLSLRPVATWAADVRKAIETDSDALQQLTGSEGLRGLHDPPPTLDEWGGKPSPPTDDPPPPPKPPLSPAAVQLDRQARALGLHLRAHLPVTPTAKLDELITLLASDLTGSMWSQTCATLGAVRACGGGSDSVFVIRDAPGGLMLDAMIFYVGNYDTPDDELRRAQIQQALTVPTATALPRVAALAGDAVLLVDGPGVVTAQRSAALASLVSSLRQFGEDGYGSEQLREREAALQQLHEVPRMFEGATVEVELRGDDMLGRTRWLPTSYGREHMPEIFELSEVDADVPSVAALCDGALVCGRTRGLPERRRFTALATGVYGQPEILAELLDDHEDEAALVLLLETWPNAIGTTAKLPGQTVDAAERYIVQNVIDVATRMLGFGFSIRSLDQTRRVVTGDWVAYARTSASDLSAIRGFLQLANAKLTPASIPEVPGRVELTPLPDDELPGNLYAIYDPAAATGEWGWAVLADGDDRVRWLAGLAHDDGSVPLAYLEIGDLWRFASAFEEGREELGFAREWMSQRWVRTQVGLGPTGPEIRMAMGKLD